MLLRPAMVTHRSRGNDSTAARSVDGSRRMIMIVSLRSPMISRSPNPPANGRVGVDARVVVGADDQDVDGFCETARSEVVGEVVGVGSVLVARRWRRRRRWTPRRSWAGWRVPTPMSARATSRSTPAPPPAMPPRGRSHRHGPTCGVAPSLNARPSTTSPITSSNVRVGSSAAVADLQASAQLGSECPPSAGSASACGVDGAVVHRDSSC